jgi:hypothetical protein
MGNHRRSAPSSTSASMGNAHSGPSTSASGKAPGSAASNRGKPASKKASSSKKRAFTDNQENSGITPDQWALYRNIRTQLAGKKKAANAAEDQGMASIFFAGWLGS